MPRKRQIMEFNGKLYTIRMVRKGITSTNACKGCAFNSKECVIIPEPCITVKNGMPRHLIFKEVTQ